MWGTPFVKSAAGGCVLGAFARTLLPRAAQHGCPHGALRIPSAGQEQPEPEMHDLEKQPASGQGCA